MASIGFLGALEGAADAGLGILKQKQADMAAEKKAAMLEKLQMQREERAEAYKIAQEQREAATNAAKVSSTRMVERDGKMVQESINDRGDVIKSEEADPYTVKKANLATRKDEVTIDKLVSDAAYSETRAAYADDIAEAGIQQKLSVADRNMRWTPGGGQPAAPVKVTTLPADQIKIYFGTKDEDGKPTIDQDRLAEFNTWQQEQASVDPRYNNASWAVAQFKSGNNALEPVTIEGTTVMRPASISADAIATGAGIITERREKGLTTDKKSLGKFLTDYSKSGGQEFVPYEEKPASNVGSDQAANLALLRKARAAISAGKLTKAEAIAQLRSKGLEVLAKRLEND